jgi:hypothetical protein
VGFGLKEFQIKQKIILQKHTTAYFRLPMPPKKQNPDIFLLKFPIWSIKIHKHRLLLSGGGGGKKVGLPNHLLVYNDTFPLMDPVYDLELSDIMIQE